MILVPILQERSEEIGESGLDGLLFVGQHREFEARGVVLVIRLAGGDAPLESISGTAIINE